MSAELSFAHSPFMRFLGLEVVRADKGVIEVRLPFREEFLRHDGTDWLHGGVVSALADIAGDYAVVTETGQECPRSTSAWTTSGPPAAATSSRWGGRCGSAVR